MRKILLIVFVLSVYHGCSQKKDENIVKNNLTEAHSSNVELILKQQLEKGISGEILNSLDTETYTYSKEDMEAVIPVAEKIILSQGYIPPSNKAFSETVYPLGFINQNVFPNFDFSIGFVEIVLFPGPSPLCPSD